MTDLEKAFAALHGKWEIYTLYFQYYEGEQPLAYMNSSRLRKIFEGLDRYFVQNWCSVVIDAERDRINLRAIDVRGEGAAKWKTLWENSRLELQSDDVHEAELVTGESFVVCWPNDDGLMEAYYNDPRMVHLFYDAEFPLRKSYAAKWWQGDDGKTYLTLYYVDRLERFSSNKPFKDLHDAKSFYLQESVPNPFGEIPVFQFRKARNVRSDLKNAIPIQDSVNKLVADMMVAAEFGAFKQRYVISNSEIQGKLKNSPDEIWDLPAGDGMSQQTQAGQFDATPLSNYLEGIDKQVIAISSITRTPKHYFFQTGSNISGEALIAMEAPLNKKAQDRIDRYIPEWRDVTMFMLRGSGVDVRVEDVTVQFDKPETIQPRTQAETRQMNTTAGIPLETQLREEGKSKKEIRRVIADVEKQRTENANLATAYLNQARTNFDQNGGGVNA